MAKKLCSELFISKLSFYNSENELKRLFSPFGVVKQARLIRDPKTQRPKGFGFVKFEKAAEAQKALKAMNGRIVQGRMIFVEFAQGSTDEANKNT
ncbi:hypothetical protein SLEP1_g17402 [Rubroshorea leprosula]|uniref:RRM domain-containing protein n=1 Tax=Rubroshorea leprosula TaxID=152421 RepID=A0AAV5J4R4_9ROSI|nr:hypothetical protein SLEP1_g17402 [Rubroshorea leprosula]